MTIPIAKYPLRRFFTVLLILTAPSALAADVSGRWSGTLEFTGQDGQTRKASAHADLKQQDHTIQGKIWKEENQQFDVEQGQTTEKEISFTFHAPEGEDEQMLAHLVKLTLVSPTQLEGTLEFDAGGQKFTGKLRFTREK